MYEDYNKGMLPNINSRQQLKNGNNSFDRDIDDKIGSFRRNYHQQDADDGYDSEYNGPRKPYMREDRSTSPPDKDPLFRKAHQRSVGIQEVDSSELMDRVPKKKSHSRKRKSPDKIKFSQNFMKKYPSLFKGIREKNQKRSEQGRVLTVVYKPWIPSTRKFTYFDEMAHKYKVY